MGFGLKIVKILSPSGLTPPPLPRVTEQQSGSPLDDKDFDVLELTLTSAESEGENLNEVLVGEGFDFSWEQVLGGLGASREGLAHGPINNDEVRKLYF